ncbi:MAG TPA: aminotransferase class I/II-fold pyridoxal phosphate-dependent enzyme [Solirubrobacteraceae bacterium]|jgi:8-amino-7-oxononanoate synthase|nr:aminotransferase class I/II-fold pyridoxal phosphate-dependent enzyme [Solirubrobacteraceae bacterium]
MEGHERVMLGSSNYLGLAAHPGVISAAHAALSQYGTALNGSRLMNGTVDLHTELEAELAEWLGTEDALVFASGYNANVGLLSAILSEADVVVCDSANHASILDGVALSGARLMPFRHGRVDRLERLLSRRVAPGGGLLVAVDSIFSMRGDVADLPRIASVCRDTGATLVVDEAHAIGVLGRDGAGVVGELGVGGETHLRVGTLSKALAGAGGFVAGDRPVIDTLRVKARSFLFTASAVPAALGAALAALRICRSPEGAELRGRLIENAEYLRKGVSATGLSTVEPSRIGERDLVTPIVPVVIGHSYYAVLLWKALYDRGVYTDVALYPATSKNGALIRLSVMATHTRQHLDQALEALAHVVKESEELHEQAATVEAFIGRVVRGGEPLRSTG